MAQAFNKSKKVQAFVDEFVALCKPKDVMWIDGSQEQADMLFKQMVDSKMAIKLNQEKRPGCYLYPVSYTHLTLPTTPYV